MKQDGARWPLVLALLLAIPGAVAAASPPVPEIVREDWYFRETLPAIRDWEAILERWEAATPESERTPILPVPASGEGVDWPNPIPATLLAGATARVQVRQAGDRVEVQRVGSDGKVTRSLEAADQPVLGCQHPGGGGKDHWYHAYFRRFDGLLRFQPRPAPFVLTLLQEAPGGDSARPAPFDLRPGANRLRISLRSVAATPLSISVRVEQHLPGTPVRACGERQWQLLPGATASVAVPVELPGPGGGMVVVTCTVAGVRYWLPILTHVEQVEPVLRGIEQILADDRAFGKPVPAQVQRHLMSLRRQARGPAMRRWRALYEEACDLRDRLLRRRIPFRTLLFVKRQPFISEQPYMDAHHLYNRPGGGIYRLSPVRPDGQVTPVVDSLGEGIYRDLCLHWSARRLLFSFGNGSDNWDGKQSYHVYEVGTDGKGLRALTTGPKNDCEPVYLPNGQIAFTSDRPEHFVMCGGDRHVANLHVMNADGSGLRQLSANVFNDFNPTILPDGRILYSRWEYNERSVTSLHKLFTMHPDGTHVAPYYGNATIRPNVTMFPRAVPGSRKVMALFTAHHGQTHGPIGLIDIGRGVDGPDPVTVLTPHVPVTGEKAEDSRFGWYSDPMPLSETTYLCSYTPTVLPWLANSWALYIGDRHGNLALIYRDREISCAEPVPLVARPRPHILPGSAPQPESGEAVLLLMDVMRGLAGVPAGEPRFLRIIEDVPRKGVHTGGVVRTAGSPIYTIKRILGTVPIAPDGSAHFVVPADRNIYFEVLDANHLEIQRMRSVVCLKAGERRTCIGCHEPRTSAPPNVRSIAFRRPPSPLTPTPVGTAILSFLRDVQPVLNQRCVRCHAFDREANRVLLTDDLTDEFCIAYQELLPYVSVANAMRWDHPDDVYPRPPYTYGSKASRLTRLLQSGHHGVTLTPEEWQRLIVWMDANAVYYDTYECRYPERRIFAPVRKAVEEVHHRRCAGCHGGNGDRDDGQQDTWWFSLNWRDVRQSRALQAPLARTAGGWGRCEGTVFASTDDPDYQTLLQLLTRVHRQLTERPREDLASVRDTPAGAQSVALPEPPPPRPAAQSLPGGDWVYLSDLRWQAARAGWTPNGDGLPRLNRDIEGHPLRVNGRRYQKGIGTHASSEITYLLDGSYDFFHAVVGATERGGSVIFQVFGDDRLLWQSAKLEGLGPGQQVDVPVAGIRRLRLVVTDAGDGIVADCATWADARLRKAGPAQP